jgi:hypothetical protein
MHCFVTSHVLNSLYYVQWDYHKIIISSSRISRRSRDGVPWVLRSGGHYCVSLVIASVLEPNLEPNARNPCRVPPRSKLLESQTAPQATVPNERTSGAIIPKSRFSRKQHIAIARACVCRERLNIGTAPKRSPERQSYG